ncbi:YjzD family protein [Granulicatella sp. s8]|uniref:YjzD family protein n=1 Tax=Granulicatella seriolae TaxID=2967226 RepID=A0ABT1WMX3_9LACT|nr:YjzD family protein [Granulicatella seriolae]
MKYLTTLFWGLILGQVTYYLGTALTSGSYDFTKALFLGIIMSVAIYIIQSFIPLKRETEQH